MKFEPIPFWQGQPLDNKIIGVIREQGFWDTIHFVRYVSLLRAKGATVILGWHESLQRLLSGAADVVVAGGYDSGHSSLGFSYFNRYGSSLFGWCISQAGMDIGSLPARVALDAEAGRLALVSHHAFIPPIQTGRLGIGNRARSDAVNRPGSRENHNGQRPCTRQRHKITFRR